MVLGKVKHQFILYNHFQLENITWNTFTMLWHLDELQLFCCILWQVRRVKRECCPALFGMLCICTVSTHCHAYPVFCLKAVCMCAIYFKAYKITRSPNKVEKLVMKMVQKEKYIFKYIFNCFISYNVKIIGNMGANAISWG